MKTKKKLTLRQHLGIFIRGMNIYGRYPKPVMLSIALSSVVAAAVPFINIYFAAQILSELAGGRDRERLVILVSLTICLGLAGMLIQRAMARWEAYCGSNNWDSAYKVLTDKAVEMDYSDTVDPEVQSEYSQIRYNQWYAGFGLASLEEPVKEILQGVIKIILAVALAFTLFTLNVPASSPYAWLDSPWAIVVVMLVFCGPVILTPYLNTLGGKVHSKDVDGDRLQNRFFNHFFYDMHEDGVAAKDIRIYDQKRIINTHIAKNPVCDWRNSKNSSWARLYREEGKYVTAGTAVTYLCNGIIFLYVAFKAFAGAFGVGGIVLYVGALTQFGMGLSAVMTSLGKLMNNNTFLAMWYNFLDIPSKMKQGHTKVEDLSKHDIEFINVSFKYPGSDDYALKNITMKFNVGERLAIVGENGSGKTTFILLLCRLYDPTEGEIRLNGVDVRQYDYDEYMSIFSIVFQDFHLLPFTLGQNVATRVDYDAARVKKSLEDAGFGERLEALPNGLETYLYKHFEEEGVEISGGEAQKIALARALYRDAPFVILDEPTAALDPIAEYEVYSKMNEIVGNKTAVFVSHRLSSCRFCHDIAVFHEGIMVQRGSHDELVADAEGKYHELWNAQAQYYQV